MLFCREQDLTLFWTEGWDKTVTESNDFQVILESSAWMENQLKYLRIKVKLASFFSAGLFSLE